LYFWNLDKRKINNHENGMPTKPTAKPNKRLQDLQAKAAQENHWALAAAAAMALADESNIDNQINVIGAMHESGMLRNQLAALWQTWRKSEATWSTRCLERLAHGDRDYWALAGLLGMSIKQAGPVFKKAGYLITSVRSCTEFDRAKTHIAVLTKPSLAISGVDDDDDGSAIWAPVLEIGWDSKSGEVVEAGRWRAIIIEKLEKVGGSLLGQGKGTYFMRAVLPHGCWRVENADFEVAREALVPIEKTLIGKG
jgi:hypothetical protein